jgi:hypothetical protein
VLGVVLVVNCFGVLMNWVMQTRAQIGEVPRFFALLLTSERFLKVSSDFQRFKRYLLSSEGIESKFSIYMSTIVTIKGALL